MNLNNKHSWTDRFRKGVGGVVLGASLLFSITALEAGTFKVDLEGCKAEPGNGYIGQTVQDIHTAHDPFTMYFCNDTSYTDGNLRGWAELDMVPHHLIIENTTGSSQDFTFFVGGDYKKNGVNVGWDYITELTLDEVATTAAGGDVDGCKAVGALTTQEIVYLDGDATIARKVIVQNFPDGLLCVPIYNMRLAIGSAAISGSSLHSQLATFIDDKQVGKKTLPIRDIPSLGFSKSMSAVPSDAGYAWTVSKKSEPATVNFGDTCADLPTLELPVTITVKWTKTQIPNTGKVQVDTVISASNSAQRDINISVVDILYSGTTELNSTTCTATIPANTSDAVCTNTFLIDPSDAVDLNDKAVATFIDPDHTHPDAVIVTTLEAVASTPNPTPGSGTNETATITEYEWLTNKTDMSYKVNSVDNTNGSFGNEYQLGVYTIEDLSWTSDSQSSSGSVIFNKTVKVNKAVIASGELKDEATVDGIEGAVATASVNLIATRTLVVTLTKEITEARDTDTDFSFEILNPDGFDRNVTLTVPAGQTSVSETYTDVDPIVYNVKEVAQAGWEPVGDATQKVDLTGEACTGSVTFTNQRADRFIDVKVRKEAFPDFIGSEDQRAGWTMTLYKETTPGSDIWTVVSTKETVGGKDEWVILANETTLEANMNYKIEETMKDGWYNIGRDSGCTFTYDGNPEQQDFECMYANAKYSTIIINKETDGDTTTKFDFTQNIDQTALTLSGGENKSYTSLVLGNYLVSENDPGADFILASLSCIDPSSNTQADSRSGEAKIVLDPGETVECTFKNIAIKNEPSVFIDKLSNGEDADEAPGPNVLVGDTVTWEYIVTNNGNIDLTNIVVTDNKVTDISCPSTTLPIGGTMICTAQGVATLGQYENVGTVTSNEASDTDLSHYLGYNTAVDDEDDEIVENCPCNDIKSDSSSTFGAISSAFMMLMTLMFGLFFVRREGQFNRNEK